MSLLSQASYSICFDFLLGSVAPQEKESIKSGLRDTGQRLSEKNALAKSKLKSTWGRQHEDKNLEDNITMKNIVKHSFGVPFKYISDRTVMFRILKTEKKGERRSPPSKQEDK